jgi:hypothetical protein
MCSYPEKMGVVWGLITSQKKAQEEGNNNMMSEASIGRNPLRKWGKDGEREVLAS